MRLLSFLSAIEKVLLAESPIIDDGAWELVRMVNFHHHLARLTITPRPGNDLSGGAIFLQGFELADGSCCLKAALNWTGSASGSTFAIYSTPQLNWKLEASRVASTWIEGPRERVISAAGAGEYRPLAAMAC